MCTDSAHIYVRIVIMYLYVIVRMHQQGFYAIQRPEANVGEATHKLITEAAGRGN